MVNSVVILAGGMGTRLWPLSTAQHPKYLIDLGIGQSLLKATVARAAQVARERIIIVTHTDHCASILKELASLKSALRKEIIIMEEPQSKNTAPAIALAVAYLLHKEQRSSTLCLPADHLIEPLTLFKEDIAQIQAIIEAHDPIVTIGIQPTRVETGYGYIERAAAIKNGYWVKAFHEKPTHTRAEHYFKSDHYYWNSGMYAFSNQQMWSELEQHVPELATAIANQKKRLFHKEQREGLTVVGLNSLLIQLYEQLPSISIDYAVAERSTQMAMLPARFRWNDVGSWDEVATLLPSHPLTKGQKGTIIAQESQDNWVMSSMQVALCGVNNLIVVTNGEKLLICQRGKSQQVKQIAEMMKDR